MSDAIKLLKTLCQLDGPSGNEDEVRDYILQEISPYCDAKVDKSGNIIAFKKGEKPAVKKVMLDAHMDEVGVIVTSITDSGLLRFVTVGGIKVDSLICKRVRFGDTVGVIGAKPIHQSSPDERKKLPAEENLYIDIGATDKEDAEKYVCLGDIGTFVGEWADMGDDLFRSKAIDDRTGCAILIELLKKSAPRDFYATFTVGEELGLRGARTATYTVDPEIAIALESTTAADLHGSSKENMVTVLGEGVAVSFMDRATLYDRDFYEFTLSLAAKKGIKAQTKASVTGGNNSGAIHQSRGGVKVITLSLPSRYIHSSASVASKSDFLAQLSFAEELLLAATNGEIK